jgi:hypothetical protein
MNDYDDDGLSGDGFMSFSGATFDVYVRPGQTFTIAANGYDQDCYDDSFGSHLLSALMYLGCNLDLAEPGNNDPLVPLPSFVDPDATTFRPPGYGVGHQDLKARILAAFPSQYELEVTIREVFDFTPPVSTVVTGPPANANGWNNTNVQLSFGATDEANGSGVAHLIVRGVGAQPFDTDSTTGTATVTITAEGVTTVTYFARDAEGNEEEHHTLTVRIDRTPPTIAGARTPAANQYGWNNTDVTVAFTCADGLSGIASCGPTPQVVGSEGAGQSRAGTAVDLAGNTAATAVGGINIDKTPPQLVGLPQNCVLWPANHKMVTVGTVTASDALSGLVPGSFAVTATSSEPADGSGDGSSNPDIAISGGTIQLRAERAGNGPGRVYRIGSTAADRAGNVAAAAATCTVPHNR